MKTIIPAIIAIILILLTFLWYNYISNISLPEISVISNQIAPKGEVKLELPPVIYEERIKSRAGKWGRDPFETSKKGKVISDLEVQAISVDAEGKGLVLINGEVYRENDIVGIYKILEIKKDYIVVDRGGSNIIIRIEKGVQR